MNRCKRPVLRLRFQPPRDRRRACRQPITPRPVSYAENVGPEAIGTNLTFAGYEFGRP